MEAVFDVLIHVEGLRNIDLFRQGLYALRFYLYALDPKARRWKGEESTATKNSEEKKKLAQYERWKRRDFEGIPYHIIRDLNPTKKEVESTMLSESERESRAVEIHSDQACFATKAFKIQFIEQVVSIKEGCHFRLKMPVAIMSKLLVYFDCELMFKEYHSSDYRSRKPLPKMEDLVPVCRKSFRLNRFSTQSIQSYYPIIMDEEHFCLTEISVHSTLLNFQFLVGRAVKARTKSPTPESLSTNKNLSPLNSPSKRDSFIEEIFSKTDVDNESEIVPHTVQEIKSLADKAFEMYVTPLLSAFFLLAAQYNRQAESFLLHKDMETHHLPVEIDSFREIENCFGKEAVENCDKSSNSPNPKLKVFSARLESLNVASIADKILIEINLLYASLFSLWHNYTNLVTLYSSKLTAHLRELWTKELSERCKSTIFRETLCVEDRYKQVDQNAIEAKSQLMNHAKNFSPMDGVDEMSIIDTYLDSDYERLIFISEQRFNDPSKELINNTESSGVGKHLIVFLHGYQGSSWDLRTFRNYMSFLYPELIFLLSSSNECLTEGDIEEMGARFAAEVDDYMKTHLDQNITRISFIAHSLGGLILRSSLIHERMIPYRDRFFTFFSLGSPHCGYLYSSNMILNTGIWALKKWYKSKSLEQLSLTDLSDPRKCFLYRLSQFSGLQYFKHVLLASSPDDKYVPYHSARMEVPKECHKDKRYGIFYEEMVRNLLSDLDSVNLVRFDVYFRHSQLDLNSVLGRSAHISFLDHRLYILMFLTVYAEFFQ